MNVFGHIDVFERNFYMCEYMVSCVCALVRNKAHKHESPRLSDRVFCEHAALMLFLWRSLGDAAERASMWVRICI